jgi:hypothetical protein
MTIWEESRCNNLKKTQMLGQPCVFFDRFIGCAWMNGDAMYQSIELLVGPTF